MVFGCAAASDVTSRRTRVLRTTMFRLTVAASARLRTGIACTRIRQLPRIAPRKNSYRTLGEHKYTSTLSSVPERCPSCSASLPTPLPACPKCFFISKPPSKTTYYDIMGLSYSPNPFEVDPAQLKGRFRDLQRVIHPDKWSGKGGVSTCLTHG